MVLISGVKYACERCIRGHRVTTCNHTDQPLIMIKPKGRPSTQCKHCKNLRVAKNAHSSGACVCGKNSGSTLTLKKKKCGCETGKSCDCHKKKQTVKRTTSLNSTKINSSLVPSSSISANSSPSTDTPNSTITAGTTITTTTTTTSTSKPKRVGEVTIPINEYIPSHSSEIGTVLNERAVASFFQDVPLPFEPGHGLLDLFETNSHPSSSHLNHYNSSQNIQNKTSTGRDFDLFQNLVFPPNNSNTSNNTKTSNSSVNNQGHKKSLFDLNDFNNNLEDISPPISDNASEHSGNSLHSSHTIQSLAGQNIHNNYNLNQSDIHKQSSGLFGNFEPYQNPEAHDSKVEVLSLTPSFNDIIPGYGTINENSIADLNHNNSNNNTDNGQHINNNFVQSQLPNESFAAFDNLNFSYPDEDPQINKSSISNLETLRRLNSLDTQ